LTISNYYCNKYYDAIYIAESNKKKRRKKKRLKGSSDDYDYDFLERHTSVIKVNTFFTVKSCIMNFTLYVLYLQNKLDI